jgi:hypothetical protein
MRLLLMGAAFAAREYRTGDSLPTGKRVRLAGAAGRQLPRGANVVAAILQQLVAEQTVT